VDGGFGLCYHGVAYLVVRRNRYSVLIVVCVPVMRGRGCDVGMRPGVEWGLPSVNCISV
jgi:hypothetical protein